MKKSGIKRNLIITILALMLVFVLPVMNAGTVFADGVYSAAVQTDGTFSDLNSASVYLKTQMVARNSEVKFTYKLPQTVSYEYSKDVEIKTASSDALGKVWKNISDQILNEALRHNGVAAEGDYLLNSMRSYKPGCSCNSIRFSSVNPSTGKYSVSFDEIDLTYSFEFYTTADQEKQFKAKADEVLSDLDLANKSEYEKVQAIYSYIIRNVEYDYKNLDNPDYSLKQSAYAALVNKTAVCQGYSSLFYYMALSAGLDSRIVVGKSVNAKGGIEAHAWNVVKIGSSYYYVDSTWDAGRLGYEYIYFLQGKNFSGHSEACIDDMGVERAPEEVVSLSATSYYTGLSKTGINKANVTGNGYFSKAKSQLFVNVAVEMNGKELLKGFDYKVEIDGYNSSLGKCSIKIVGIGLYDSYVAKDINVIQAKDDVSAFCNDDTTVVTVTFSNGSADVKDPNGKNSSGETKNKTKTDSSKDNEASAGANVIKVGTTFKSGNYTYKISKTGASLEVKLVTAKKGIKTAVVPETVKYKGKVFKVTGIGKNAFKGNKKLSKVIIGKNVKTIEANAFAGCSGLKSFTFKGTAVSKIGSKAFKGTGTKVKVTVPKKSFAKYKKMLIKGGLSKKVTVK
jgi:hypothetical protein